MISKYTAKFGQINSGHLEFDLAHDEDIPRQLQESLFSQPSGDFEYDEDEYFESHWESTTTSKVSTVSFSTHRSKVTIAGNDEIEEAWETARSCPLDCIHEDCPFQPQKSISCFTLAVRPKSSLSTKSLVEKVSAASMVEWKSSVQKFPSKEIVALGNDLKAAIRITHLVPLRDDAVVVHWKIDSIEGVYGFKVRLRLKAFLQF